MSNDIDLKAIRDDLAESLVTTLKGVVEGADEDVQLFAVDVASALVTSRARPGSEVEMQHLNAQLRALAAINKIRLVDAQWEVFGKVTTVARGILAGLLGNLGGLI